MARFTLKGLSPVPSQRREALLNAAAHTAKVDEGFLEKIRGARSGPEMTEALAESCLTVRELERIAGQLQNQSHTSILVSMGISGVALTGLAIYAVKQKGPKILPFYGLLGAVYAAGVSDLLQRKKLATSCMEAADLLERGTRSPTQAEQPELDAEAKTEDKADRRESGDSGFSAASAFGRPGTGSSSTRP